MHTSSLPQKVQFEDETKIVQMTKEHYREKQRNYCNLKCIYICLQNKQKKHCKLLSCTSELNHISCSKNTLFWFLIIFLYNFDIHIKISFNLMLL